MTLGKTTAFRARAFAIMLVVMAGSVTCGPASAQYWGDRSSGGWGRSGGWGGWGGWGEGYPSERHYRRSPHRDFFLRFLASATIVQRQPSITRRRRRRVNWKHRRAKQ